MSQQVPRTLKVNIQPSLEVFRSTESGIKRIVEAMYRYLPDFGVQVVSADEPYDLKIVHAGATAGDVDVMMCAGLYWTADYEASANEYATNANVIEALRCAYEVIVPSEWVHENIARDMHLRSHVIGHGIDWQSWQHNRPSKGYALWNKNRPSDVCTPHWVGVLARAFPDEKFLSTFLDAGDKDLPNIRTTGGVVPHNEMRTMVQECGVYLATTKETFGIGTLEAMAAGKPVLAFRHGGAVDMVEHGVSGYLANPGDEEDLIQGFKYCLENAAALGEAAREKAREYDWHTICGQYYQVLLKAWEKKNQPPTVTVVIPCYNYAHKVGIAIQSVQAQEYKDFCCIIVDDGSTDGSAEVIDKLIDNDDRFTLIRQHNRGVAHARNSGIEASNTKYVCCLDADDAIAPSFLSDCVKALENDRGLAIAYTRLTAVLPDGRIDVSPWPGEFNYDEQLKRNNQVPTCCVFRRWVWERLAGYRQRYAPEGAGAEDAEFWLRCGAIGARARLVSQKPSFVYSLGSGRVSGNRRYREADWTAWHPWVRDGEHPFASLARPKLHSHPVRQYDEPLVSVIIPVGPGHATFLLDALDSLEAQTYRRWEVIVIDDTGGEDVRGQYEDAFPFVHWTLTEGRVGAGKARNLGRSLARGQFLVPLDADDILQPEFLDITLRVWYNFGGGWVYTDMWSIHPSGKVESYAMADWNVEKLWASALAPVTCLYEAKHWDEVGGFHEEMNWEDWDFHLRLAEAGICGIRAPYSLISYRLGTGMRRARVNAHGSDGKREAAEFLHAKYPLEELEMACRGCGHRSVPQRPGSVEMTTVKAGEIPEGWVLVEYVCGNKSDQRWRGAGGGRYYTFGNNKYHKVAAVHPDDVEWLVGHNCFELFRGHPAGAPQLQVHHAPQQPPPPPQPRSTQPEPIRAQDSAIQELARKLAQPLAPTPAPQPVEQSAPPPQLAPAQEQEREVPVIMDRPQPRNLDVNAADVIPGPETMTIAELEAQRLTRKQWFAQAMAEETGKARKGALAFLREMAKAGALYPDDRRYGQDEAEHNVGTVPEFSRRERPAFSVVDAELDEDELED